MDNNSIKNLNEKKDPKQLNRENYNKYYKENRDLILAKREWKKINGSIPTKDELLQSEFYKERRKNNKWIDERIKYNDNTINKNERLLFLKKNRKEKQENIIND